MKKLACILAILVTASCGLFKPKIIVETQIVYRDRVIHDTTTFEIPQIVEKIVTKDTVSHLENPYAKSDAVVSEGMLWHSLESIPQIIKVPFEVEVRDTTYIEKEAEPIEVEKKLTSMQQFELDYFWIVFIIAVLLLLWAFRKPIISLIKKL